MTLIFSLPGILFETGGAVFQSHFALFQFTSLLGSPTDGSTEMKPVFNWTVGLVDWWGKNQFIASVVCFDVTIGSNGADFREKQLTEKKLN